MTVLNKREFLCKHYLWLNRIYMIRRDIAILLRRKSSLKDVKCKCHGYGSTNWFITRIKLRMEMNRKKKELEYVKSEARYTKLIWSISRSRGSSWRS